MGFLDPKIDKATMGCDYIFDLRPVANARANGIKNGGGAEETMYYAARGRLCKMLNADIPNIYAVRRSYEKLEAICKEGYDSKSGQQPSGWTREYADSQWSDHIVTLMNAAKQVTSTWRGFVAHST